MPQRIVVRAPNWLGDLMMATGALHAVLDCWPAASVDLIVRAGHEGLPLPHRGRIIVFGGSGAAAGSFGSSLRQSRYDRFYVLPPSFSSAWMAWRSGVPERIGYRGQFRAPLLRPALSPAWPARSVHLSREYLGLVAPRLGAAAAAPRLDLPPDWAAGQLGRICRTVPERFVALAPGAVYGPAKAWPAQRFQELARDLRDRSGMPVLLLGTAAEHGLAEQVRDGEAGILNWCGTTDVPGLVAVLSRAALLVSNDSGTMHVMAALGRPQVALFGSTSPTWTGPVNARAAVIAHGPACAPCYARTCRYRHYDCLRKITAAEVLAAALALLGETPARPS